MQEQVMVNDQVQRIERNVAGEAPPPVALRFRFEGPTKPDNVLERAQVVMREIAEAQSSRWPSDDEWRRRLPEWFLSSFEGHTLEELLSNPNLWDFGSWLDAMKAPGWEWWSCEVGEKSGSVRCAAFSDPYGVEPLEYLLRSAGASEVEFGEEAD